MHRPHTVIGLAVGNAMNLGTTLAVYASICKETGRPFQLPGSEAQWKGLSDVTDARMLAKHLVWAADTDAARNEAFNIVNGDIFRWSWLWPKLAEWFGVEAAGFDGTVQPLEAAMANDHALWREIAQRHGLAEPDLDRLASAWHTDLDLGRPIEVMTDMANSRKLGFSAYPAHRRFVLRPVRAAARRSADPLIGGGRKKPRAGRRCPGLRAVGGTEGRAVPPALRARAVVRRRAP